MGCCEALSRILLVLVNILTLAVGLIMLVVGIVYKLGKEDYWPEMKDYSTSMAGVSLGCIIFGAVITVVALLGCMGAILKKNGILNFYFIIVLLCLLLQVALIIFTIVRKDAVISQIKTGVSETFEVVKSGNATVNQKLATSSLEFTAECCGLTGPDFWDNPTWVPAGCCAGFDGTSTEWTCPTADAWSGGCLDVVPAKVADNAWALLIIVIIIMVIEFVCLLAACYSKKQDLIA